MTIKVISEGPVFTRKHVCKMCGYELEFNDIDLVPHRFDYEGDPIEPRGKYLVCPRAPRKHRSLIDPAPRVF